MDALQPEGISVHTPLAQPSQKGFEMELSPSIRTTRDTTHVSTIESESPGILIRRQQICRSHNAESSSNLAARSLTATKALWLKTPGRLPYFELLDLVDSLYLGKFYSCGVSNTLTDIRHQETTQLNFFTRKFLTLLGTSTYLLSIPYLETGQRSHTSSAQPRTS